MKQLADSNIEVIVEKLRTLSTGPGVYLMKDKHLRVIYVGKATNLRNRVKSYFRYRIRDEGEDDSGHADIKTEFLVSRIWDFETIFTQSESEALVLEANLIKQYQPRYNVRLKDDKRYPYICISTSEPFPRVFITRKLDRIKRHTAMTDSTDTFFGPFTDVFFLRESLEELHKIFKIRTCRLKLPKEKLTRPCLEYDLGRCDAPCTDYISQADYTKQVNNIIQLFNGHGEDIISDLREKMLVYSQNMEYEKAADCRDQLRGIEAMLKKQNVDLLTNDDGDLLALFREKKDVCVVQMKIRSGRLTERNHFFFSGESQLPDSEFLEAFIREFYLDRQHLSLAKLLYLEVPLENSDIYSEILSEAAGHQVTLETLPAQEDRDMAEVAEVVSIYGSGDKGKKERFQRLMNLARKNAQMVLAEELARRIFRDKRGALKEIQDKVGLFQLPRRIECIDISTLQGKATVASLVCFYDGMPEKKRYRRFRIKSSSGKPDDYSAIYEVIVRHLQRLSVENIAMPDLLLIDGGKGQLNAALQAAGDLGIEPLPAMAGLAKREEQIFVPGFSDPLSWDKNAKGVLLLRTIRDETHRFGVTYQRKLRWRQNLNSVLDEVPGIGPNIRQAIQGKLLATKSVADLTVEDLSTVPGVGKKRASIIYEFLHKSTNEDPESH